jgi:hypothetical protein
MGTKHDKEKKKKKRRKLMAIQANAPWKYEIELAKQKDLPAKEIFFRSLSMSLHRSASKV